MDHLFLCYQFIISIDHIKLPFYDCISHILILAYNKKNFFSVLRFVQLVKFGAKWCHRLCPSLELCAC